jgi:hypothetical protein
MSIVSKVVCYFGGSFKHLFFAVVLLVAALGLVLAPAPGIIEVAAQPTIPALPSQVSGDASLGSEELAQKIFDIANWVVFIFAAVAVLVIIWGGVRWGTDDGSGSGAQAGKKIVINGIIGLVIAGLSFIIISVVIGIMQGVQNVVGEG